MPAALEVGPASAMVAVARAAVAKVVVVQMGGWAAAKGEGQIVATLGAVETAAGAMMAVGVGIVASLRALRAEG